MSDGYEGLEMDGGLEESRGTILLFFLTLTKL